MVCPFCTSKTKIYNSRKTFGGTQTWRRHRCLNCARPFTTRERVDYSGVIKVTDDKDASPYSRERLLLSLVRATQNLELPSGTLSSLCDTIEEQMRSKQLFNHIMIKSEAITTEVMLVLHRFDPNIALQYINQVYRNQPPLELVKRLVEK